VSNRVRCRMCGTVLESKSVHDFQRCSCPNRTFTDGGEEYQRIGGADLGQIEILDTPAGPAADPDNTGAGFLEHLEQGARMMTVHGHPGRAARQEAGAEPSLRPRRDSAMRIGARAGFDRMEELEPHFAGVDFPIELAVPYRVGDFLQVAGRMEEVRDFVRRKGIEVLSLHAAQGNLVKTDHLSWAQPALWLADQLGARSVTFHPSRVGSSGRAQAQEVFVARVSELQRGTNARIAVETFGGKDRVLSPRDIVRTGLPMILDTAHIHSDDEILSLIADYHQNIPAIHLSARGGNEHHLPVDAFCLKVVERLMDTGWSGSLVLEYLPWHQYRVRDDLVLLKRFLEGERSLDVPPPDDSRRNDPSGWGFV